jgi:cation diffusion facilitator CzcD-associated flavoprotein CzcO
MATKIPPVVIIGGGFGGLAAAKELKQEALSASHKFLSAPASKLK